MSRGEIGTSTDTRLWRRRAVTLLSAGICAAGIAFQGIYGVMVTGITAQAHAVNPLASEVSFVSSATSPPSETECFAQNIRCFAPAAMQASYNVTPLYQSGFNGKGQTIVIVDSFGSAYIRNDLRVFNDAFGLQHMCGEQNVTCSSGMPTFQILQQGNVPQNPPPPNNGTGQQNHNLWDGEATLDVEWSHAIAPMANILLVTTPNAETLGVQGFPDMIKAEDYVIKNHLGSVISQSFGSAEQDFNGTQSLLNLRYAYQDAEAAGITVLASSGDFGTANITKQPVKKAVTIPYPTVDWPASDPLVTGVGGTYLCTDPTTGLTVDSADPPSRCQNNPGQREVGWVAGGGGFSSIFATPSYQNTLPAGSTPITSMRGVPDVAYDASGRTGVLVYLSDPTAGQEFGAGPGWYDFGGTSAGSPQWAGLIAIADQMNGGPLGFINPGLYKIGADPDRYAKDFYDVTVGNNQFDPSVPGYNASTGWDPVTGLGTPNAANLLPDLISAVHGK